MIINIDNPLSVLALALFVIAVIEFGRSLVWLAVGNPKRPGSATRKRRRTHDEKRRRTRDG